MERPRTAEDLKEHVESGMVEANYRFGYVVPQVQQGFFRECVLDALSGLDLLDPRNPFREERLLADELFSIYQFQCAVFTSLGPVPEYDGIPGILFRSDDTCAAYTSSASHSFLKIDAGLIADHRRAANDTGKIQHLERVRKVTLPESGLVLRFSCDFVFEAGRDPEEDFVVTEVRPLVTKQLKELPYDVMMLDAYRCIVDTMEGFDMSGFRGARMTFDNPEGDSFSEDNVRPF